MLHWFKDLCENQNILDTVRSFFRPVNEHVHGVNSVFHLSIKLACMCHPVGVHVLYFSFVAASAAQIKYVILAGARRGHISTKQRDMEETLAHIL